MTARTDQAGPHAGTQQRNGPFFVEPMLGSEGEHINAAQIAIRRIANQPFDCGDGIRVGGLSQYAEKSFGFAHRFMSVVISSLDLAN
jgi:hypothetical protein